MQIGQMKRCWSFPGYVTFYMTQAKNSMNSFVQTEPELDMHTDGTGACPDCRVEAWPDTDEELDLEPDMAFETESHLTHWQQSGTGGPCRTLQETILPQAGQHDTNRAGEIMQGDFQDAQRRVVSLEAALHQQQQQQQQNPALPPMSSQTPSAMPVPVTTHLLLPIKACSSRGTLANVLIPDLKMLTTAPVISTFSGSPLSTTPQARKNVPRSQRVLPIGAGPNFDSEDYGFDSALASEDNMSFKSSGSSSAHLSCDSLKPKPPGPLPVGLCSQTLQEHGSNRAAQFSGDIQGARPNSISEDSGFESIVVCEDNTNFKYSSSSSELISCDSSNPKPAGPLPVGLCSQILQEHRSNRVTQVTGDIQVQQAKTRETASSRKPRAMLPAISGDISALALKRASQIIGASKRPSLARNKETARRSSSVLLGAHSTQNSHECPLKDIMPVGLIPRA